MNRMRKSISLVMTAALVIAFGVSCSNSDATWPRELETDPLFVWNEWPYESIFYYSSWMGLGNVSKVVEAAHLQGKDLSSYTMYYDEKGRIVEMDSDVVHYLLNYETINEDVKNRALKESV